MGRMGTDVAREAADIGKVLPYVLASNVAEILPFQAMVALAIAAALTVLQILVVDLGTDQLPALALEAGTAEPMWQAMQRQASAVNFTTIVLGQLGGLMACRSERVPALGCLGLHWFIQNPLLGLGIGSELAIAAGLVLIAPLAHVLELAPIPAGWQGWMVAVPVLVVLGDDARKRWLRAHPQRCSINAAAG